MGKALVVEDIDDIIPAIEDTLVVRGDTYDRATTLEEARQLFAANDYSYVLLDLKIPARIGGAFPDTSYGIAFLKDMRANEDKGDTPVIGMTSHVAEGFGLATELHNLGINACVSKPFDEKRPLLKVIEEVLVAHQAASERAKQQPSVADLTPFGAESREMVIYEDRVTVCGIEIWRDCGQPDMRRIFLMLMEQEAGNYVRISGRKLVDALNRDPSNPVGRPIKDFRDDASTLLAQHRQLDCGRYDIIGRGGGGYHLTDCMRVRVDGAQAAKPEEPGPLSVNERQQWVLDQIDQGERISQKNAIAHFRRQWNASTIKRDLKALRDVGLIETHPDGYYIRRSEGRRS